jgi:sporulation protein YlmC with PRC-barrel domain
MEVTMNRILAIATGLALGGSMAIAAAQEQESQDYEPSRDIVTETESDRGTGMETPRQDTPVQSEYGTEPETQTESDMTTDPYGTDQGTEQSQSGTGMESESTGQSASTQDDMAHEDMSELTADKLSGRAVVTSTGEEIGEIDEVGYSATHQERVAVIEAGGFLGVGEKRIALPLSELEMGTDDSVTTTMTRESIESQEEFDEAGFTADETDHQPGETTEYE